jgi:hypothetical protein
MIALSYRFCRQPDKFPKLMSSQAVCARFDSQCPPQLIQIHQEHINIALRKHRWCRTRNLGSKTEFGGKFRFAPRNSRASTTTRRSRQRARGGDRPSATAERRARLPEHGRPADCSSHSWRGRHQDRAIYLGRWWKVFRKGHFLSVPAMSCRASGWIGRTLPLPFVRNQPVRACRCHTLTADALIAGTYCGRRTRRVDA